MGVTEQSADPGSDGVRSEMLGSSEWPEAGGAFRKVLVANR